MTNQEFEDLCTNCGLCCVFAEHDCKFLKRDSRTSKTSCSIYGGNIGTYLGEGYYCNSIMDVPTLYDDCPYNNLKIGVMLEKANTPEPTILQIIHNNA